MRRRCRIDGHAANRIGYGFVHHGCHRVVIDMAVLLFRMRPLIPVGGCVGKLLVHKHEFILLNKAVECRRISFPVRRNVTPRRTGVAESG